MCGQLIVRVSAQDRKAPTEELLRRRPQPLRKDGNMKVYLSEYIHPAAVEHLKSHAEIVDNFDHPGELDGMVVRRKGDPRND